MAASKRKLPREPVALDVHGMSHEGRGIARRNERTVFVDGALPGEQVYARVVKRHRQREEAITQEVVNASAERITARCAHFGVCGGCSLQHIDAAHQLIHKEGVLREHFSHIGRVAPQHWLPALQGQPWGYRRKARLGAKLVTGKGDRVLVGFREKHGSLIADLSHCHVLEPRVGRLLPELGALVRGLSIPARIPQIEVALGDVQGGLVFRNLTAFTDADQAALIAFGERHGLWVYEQPGNAATVRALRGDTPALTYALPRHAIELAFQPTDFIQVNGEVNRMIVDRVVEWLALEGGERVADLFCGLGNFSLPVARQAGAVVGIEGDEGLVARARGNAQRNGIDNATFISADLSRQTDTLPGLEHGCERVLLDPPRSGAADIVPALARSAPERIVYVSCGPTTLARDVGTLVHRHGYHLSAAGVMDMFPHTAHIETIAVLDRDH